MSNTSSIFNGLISLPKGGGALSGIGETFSPDLHTGTGNFSVPIVLPTGRNGIQPQINLTYSTGNGNGFFGLGWALGVPGVSRKTAKGVPRYDDAGDVFLLSGAEDLVAVAKEAGITRYQPRTEGLFAHITRVLDADNDYWEVRSKDGLVSLYGTPGARRNDPAVIANPADSDKLFAWKLSETRDPFGNRIVYEYVRDMGSEGLRQWDQLYLSQIRYVDYEDANDARRFLVSVEFAYEDRPDSFSDHRAGFEIRTRRRCRRIAVRTHADDQDILVRTVQFDYSQDPHNGVSLLTQVVATGHDGNDSETLPPLTFGYTRFNPGGRDFFPVEGRDLPAHSLASPDLALADLFGNGLPDILEMNGVVRYWRNLGGGRFDLPRSMKDAPAGLALADPDVQLLDADGDGRVDLMVTQNGLSGTFPLQHNGEWDRRSFRRFRQAPSFSLADPEVRLVDLDGDGVTDAIRSGSRLECYFNDANEGWSRTRFVPRQALDVFPNVSFADPRVHWADLSGDGLQDIALIHDGSVAYWPSLGHGDWGPRIAMQNSPRFPHGYDPRRILVGDVDGDGLADIVYVDHQRVVLWINQSGNGWSEPIEYGGTPPVSDMDAVRLVDLLGSGIAGLLWTTDARGNGRPTMHFLDFTGGVKPYLLNEMDNHMGALTRVGYAPSTRYFQEDAARPETRWSTPLPFPVQVVARVEVIDQLSGGKLATEYRYHHGYWDGAEREFRGFGLVEQLDSEVFEVYREAGLHRDQPFTPVETGHFSPPTLTKTWFHQGPVGPEHGDWFELDHSPHAEAGSGPASPEPEDGFDPLQSRRFWPGDEPLLPRAPATVEFLQGLPRRAQRDALRALRGSVLRTELYALDGSERQSRPYTVAESQFGLREETPPGPGNPDRPRIFFPHALAQRTTQWERGSDPMTQFSFSGDYDAYGQPLRQMQAACPRGWRTLDDLPAEIGGAEHERRFLVTRSLTTYAQRDDANGYMVNRVARATSLEIQNDGSQPLLELVGLPDDHPALRVIGQSINYYDGEAFVGLPFGQPGDFGALVRSEALALTEGLLHDAYRPDGVSAGTLDIPPYLLPGASPDWTGEYPAAFRDALENQHPLAGYTFADGSDHRSRGYFVQATRTRFDFQDPGAPSQRGLPLAMRDPLGNDTTVDRYDPFSLLPLQVSDAVGLSSAAEYDYRVLQPSRVIDPNGNGQSFGYSPLGLLRWSAVSGKDGEGDTVEAPGARFEYDFLAFANSPPDDRQPAWVRAVRRVHHPADVDVPLPQRDESITTVEYSDGFGRLLQTRTEAEDIRFGDPVFGHGVLPADQDDAAGTAAPIAGRQRLDGDPANVVVNGWKTYNNKGWVVESYEPFFGHGWDYLSRAEAQALAANGGPNLFGQKATMHYDPRGQVIRTVNPDGSEQRVIYGVPADLSAPEAFEPTPWEAFTYDANDNAGRTHPVEAQAYAHHWNTPASIEIDPLGRTVTAVERNGPQPADWLITRSTYDIRGNLLTLTDALGRVAFRHVYDLANNPWRVDSIDAGLKRTVLDARGSPLEQRDGKGALALSLSDPLNRPVVLWARDDGESPVTLRQRLHYGDGGDPQQPDAQREVQRQANRLGRLHRHFDEAGLAAVERYDFKGNATESVRQVIGDAAIMAVFPDPEDTAPDWTVAPFRVDWAQPGAEDLLDATAYRATTAYDALNRPKRMRYPQDVQGQRQELVLRYNRAGALEAVDLNGAAFVEHIAYDAKGQRTLIAYGNGVLTRYVYDPLTSRLARLRSERFSQQAPATFRPTGAPVQDLAYQYDLAGNILRIVDRTPGCGVRNNPQAAEFMGSPLAQLLSAGDALVRRFQYDAIYRLTGARGGREANDIDRPLPWGENPPWRGYNSGNHGTPSQDNAPDLTRLYDEVYSYDAAGNLTRLQHSTAGGGFTRELAVLAENNRLDRVTVGQTVFDYAYDASGNLVREATSRHYRWDHADCLKAFRTQAGAAEPSMYAHYLYDAAGQRVKKLVRQQGGQVETTVYAGGVFEHHRQGAGGGARENNTLHVLDDRSRVALVRVGAPFDGDPAPAVQFHLGDHLASSQVVIAGDGTFVNREEFTPYGETSFGSFGRKRYRFTGQERDEESGLSYHSARYYMPWLCRWASSDPAGVTDGTNLFVYARNSPVGRQDPNGKQSTPVERVGTTTVETITRKELVGIGQYQYSTVKVDTNGNVEETKQAEYDPRFFIIGVSASPIPKELADIATDDDALQDYFEQKALLGIEERQQDMMEAAHRYEVVDQVALVLAITMIPGVGEFLAGEEATSPAATKGERAIASADLTLSMVTGGLTPNFSVLSRAWRTPSKVARQLKRGVPLGDTQKDALRVSAREIWQVANRPIKAGEKVDIHHIIPLEYAHLYPELDPNDISNLVALSRSEHQWFHSTFQKLRQQFHRQTGRAPTGKKVAQAMKSHLANLPPEAFIQ